MGTFQESLTPIFKLEGSLMYVQNKTIIIVCEGPSERAYIQELNRYLEEEEIPLNFIPRPSNGGLYTLVQKKYREVRKNNRSTRIIIWVDWDRYQRNDNCDMDNYQSKPDDIPNFLFSYQNFEDFLSMHCNRSEMQKWWSSCVSRNHFTTPSHSKEYIPVFVTFIGGHYSKGELPITIDRQSLNNLKIHQRDTSIPFKCDFAKELFRLIDTEEYDLFSV